MTLDDVELTRCITRTNLDRLVHRMKQEALVADMALDVAIDHALRTVVLLTAHEGANVGFGKVEAILGAVPVALGSSPVLDVSREVLHQLRRLEIETEGTSAITPGMSTEYLHAFNQRLLAVLTTGPPELVSSSNERWSNGPAPSSAHARSNILGRSVWRSKGIVSHRESSLRLGKKYQGCVV